MTIVEKALAVILGKTPAAQLTAIRQRIAAAEAEIARLDGEIARRAMAILTGNHEAARVAGECEREKRALVAELATLRAGEADRARAVAAEEAARRQAEAAAKPALIAAAVADALEADDRVHAAAQALREGLDASRAAKQRLAALAASETLRRAATVALPAAKGAIAPIFNETRGEGGIDNMLGLTSTWVGERSRLTLRELDRELFDDTAPYYLTRDEAEAAQQRLAARATPSVITAAGPNCWTVVPHTALFVTREDADRAMAAANHHGHKVAVVPHPPGWRLMPAHLADSEEAA